MARSPVFKAMFTHQMAESVSNEVKIDDFSAEVVREFLCFLYSDTNSCEEEPNHMMICNLLRIATKYQVLTMQSRCEALIEGQITVDNVFAVASLANACG